MEGWSEGKTNPIFRTLQAEDGGLKNPQSKIGFLASIRGYVHLIITVLDL